MRLSKLTLEKMADAIENQLRGTGHQYVLLTFNEKHDKCDFISTVAPDEVMLLVADWLKGMLKDQSWMGGQASPSERGDH